MANRALRGGAAAVYAARMTEEINLGEDEHEPDELENDIEPVVEEEDEPEPPAEPDYSHIEDEPEEEPEPKAETPDALADLQRQLAEMQSENEQLKAGAARSEETELQSQHALIITGMSRAKGALATAQDDYEKAAAAGDWKKASAAQVAIARAVADIGDFEAAADEVKGVIEERRNAPKQTQRAAPADPFEASISKMSDPSKEWCRAHKADLTKSPTRGNLALVGHQMALEEGLKVDTPEYFAFLDKHMGYEAPAVTTKKQPAPKPTGKPRMAAPAGARAAPAKGAAEVKLSKSEVQIAQSMGMSLKDYARNKAEIIQNGHDHTRSGPRYSQQTAANRR